MFPPGYCPTQSNCLVGSLASGVQQLYRLNSWNVFTEEFRKLSLQNRCAGSKKAGPFTQNLYHCLRHVWIIVAQEMRTKCSVVINILVAVHIPNQGSFSSRKSDFWFNCAIDRYYATGNV